MLHALLANGLDRRSVLRGAVASTTMLGVAACKQELQPGESSELSNDTPDSFKNFDPMNRRDNLETFIRMSGSLDETEDAFGWFSARIFSVIGDFKIIQPLFDLEGFGVSRHEKQPDGSYKRYQLECGFYKDLYLSLIHI